MKLFLKDRGRINYVGIIGSLGQAKGAVVLRLATGRSLVMRQCGNEPSRTRPLDMYRTR